MAANSLCLNRFFVSLFKGNLWMWQRTKDKCALRIQDVLYKMRVWVISGFFHRIKEIDEIIKILVEMCKQLHRAFCCYRTIR